MTGRWQLGASAVLVVAVAGVGIAAYDQPAGSNASGSQSTSASDTPTPSMSAEPAESQPAVAMAAGVPTLARSVPMHLSIGAIHVSVSLSQLGLNPDGTAEVPTNFAEPGWYRLGVSPGQLGSAVILGHVHGNAGPSVFWNVAKLRKGDRITVTLADGDVAEFAVRVVRSYAKADFPATLVYGTHDYSALNLVTCGGVYDKKNHRFLSNVVAYASLVSTTKATH